MKKPSYSNALVRITNDSPVSDKAMLSLGDVGIPFYEVTIRLKVGEFATIEAKVPIEALDLVAFQEHTKIEVVQPEPLTPTPAQSGTSESA